MMIKPGVYKHFKGNLYRVIGIGLDSETLEEKVIYQALYGNEEFWVRPVHMWNELVEKDGKMVPRFAWVREY